ncbi:MAG TPA: site-2 protease family protein [Gaiellaceae bacterium]|nr:site-2 protease family protein [Gaiellaceae bacterium]
MTSTFRLGRVAGIEIGVNWTWLFVFWLITWTLAEAVFPAQNPGHSTGGYWAMALVAAVLFFTSLLLHELGHALQARREGVEIEGITLWLLGGVAKFRTMWQSAGAEFRIAIAGPAVSLVLSVGLLALGAAAPLPSPVEGVVFWLGYINGVLLVFNLLPALPLDGGRVLHSALWAWKRSLADATRIGTGVGRAFGWLFVAAGVVIALAGPVVSGIWLVVLGWFIQMAAQAEGQQVAVREALRGVRVRDLMTRDPVAVDADTTLGEFMDRVAWGTRFTTYPVLEGRLPVGLLTFRRVADTPRTEWDARRVRDCMIPLEAVPVVRADEEAAEVLATFGAGDVNRALVLRNGELEGVVSITDLARAVDLAGRGVHVHAPRAG